MTTDFTTLTPRRARAKKKVKRKLSKRKLRVVLAKRRATQSRNKQLAYEKAHPPKPFSCQHPRARGRGLCACPAIGETDAQGQFTPQSFTVPDDYIPKLRYANQPQLPRPEAWLCIQHKYLIDAHLEADERPADFPHRSQCGVCGHMSQPRVEKVLASWLNFIISGATAAAELGVSYHSFMQHVYYYRLDEKRADKAQTRKFLLGMMDNSIGAKVSAKDGLAAAAQLSKERGDVTNIDARVVVADLASMTDKEIAQRARELAAQIEAQSREAQ
jgi:hypothetical protein